MDSKEQLQAEIQSLEEEVARLSSLQYKENIYETLEGGDVSKKAEIDFDTVGSQSQIMNVQSRLQQKREQLLRMEQYEKEGKFGKISNNPQSVPSNESDRQIKQDIKSSKEKEEKSIIEKARIQDFKRIKSIYKARTSAFARVIETLSGKSPKWKVIKNYSQSELDTLLDFYQKSTNAITEKEKNSKWLEFVVVLKNKQLLDTYKTKNNGGVRHGR